MFRNHRKPIQQAVLTACIVVAFAAGTAAQAATINFNTDDAGNTYTGFSGRASMPPWASPSTTVIRRRRGCSLRGC